jgi:hypothetical protein
LLCDLSHPFLFANQSLFGPCFAFISLVNCQNASVFGVVFIFYYSDFKTFILSMIINFLFHKPLNEKKKNVPIKIVAKKLLFGQGSQVKFINHLLKFFLFPKHLLLQH